jgi:hypothetical protein
MSPPRLRGQERSESFNTRGDAVLTGRLGLRALQPEEARDIRPGPAPGPAAPCDYRRRIRPMSARTASEKWALVALQTYYVGNTRNVPARSPHTSHRHLQRPPHGRASVWAHTPSVWPSKASVWPQKRRQRGLRRSRTTGIAPVPGENGPFLSMATQIFLCTVRVRVPHVVQDKNLKFRFASCGRKVPARQSPSHPISLRVGKVSSPGFRAVLTVKTSDGRVPLPPGIE